MNFLFAQEQKKKSKAIHKTYYYKIVDGKEVAVEVKRTRYKYDYNKKVRFNFKKNESSSSFKIALNKEKNNFRYQKASLGRDPAFTKVYSTARIITRMTGFAKENLKNTSHNAFHIYRKQM